MQLFLVYIFFKLLLTSIMSSYVLYKGVVSCKYYFNLIQILDVISLF